MVVTDSLREEDRPSEVLPEAALVVRVIIPKLFYIFAIAIVIFDNEKDEKSRDDHYVVSTNDTAVIIISS